MGEEGVGKSTLLRAMAGILPSEFRVSGDVQVKVPTYCDQFVDTCWFKTDPYEYLFKKLPSDEFDIANWNRYTEVASFFAKMNLDIDKFFSEGKVVGQLSGGELKKLQIAKALLRSTSVLLLDEPTNHLDLKTIVWLEDVVKNFDGTVVLVSHDETFLDHTSSHILYMQHKKGQKPLYRLSGNGYKSFIEEFKSEAERTKQRAEEFDRNQKKRHYLGLKRQNLRGLQIRDELEEGWLSLYKIFHKGAIEFSEKLNVQMSSKLISKLFFHLWKIVLYQMGK